jgi:hypothetical protein
MKRMLFVYLVLLPLSIMKITSADAVVNHIYLPLIIRGQTISNPNSTPTSTHTITPLSTPTPTPTQTQIPSPDVEVLENYKAVVDTSGYFHLYGEIKNNTSDNLEQVRVMVNLLDDQFKVVNSDWADIWLNILPADAQTCFHFITVDPPGAKFFDIAQIEYLVTNFALPKFIWGYTRSYSTPPPKVTISGEVHNLLASKRVEDVTPVVTFYNSIGDVIGCEYTHIDGYHLDPDQVGTFVLFYEWPYPEQVVGERLQLGGKIP